MNFTKKFKGVIIAVVISAIALAISFYYPEQENTTTDELINEPVIEDVLTETAKPEETEIIASTPTPTPTPRLVAPLETAEPQAVVAEKNTLFCSLTVRCDTLLNNIEKVSPEKIPFIPESGIILPETELEFVEGETVFDVLEEELKKRGIHFEFSKVSMYDSCYIEGVGNLYEFDCGNLSGWLYRVNGQVLSVGCSQYQLKNGDKIEFLYTCNMGRDL